MNKVEKEEHQGNVLGVYGGITNQEVVCANNAENARKLRGYQIGKPADLPCKVNFYTSTCFEGCDIFDEQGKTYIVSNGKNPNILYIRCLLQI
jgi:hypothetical protein